MPTPLLSVVVPTYNNARTIEETLTSVLDQTDVDFELIVSDHSSTDSTRETVKRLATDPRVTLTSTEAGGGAQRNWNHATSMARGEYLKLVCGDDVLRSGTLARQVALLQSTGAVLTACQRDIVDADGSVLMQDWGLRGLSKPMPGWLAARKAVRAGSNLFGEPASVMMQRSALAASGGWFGDYPYLIDQATYSRVLLTGDFAPDLVTGATFRMSASQWSVALAKQQSVQARGFHAWMNGEFPTTVRRSDRLIGDVRATLMARARRIAYRALKRRMR